MNRLTVTLFVILLAILLGGCDGGLPFDLEFSPNEGQPSATPLPPVRTITPAASLVPSLTPSETLTHTPVPTQRSPYPVNLGTPMPDAGFPIISSGNVQSMEQVFQHSADLRRAAVISASEKKALIATSQGLSLYSIQDGLIAYWSEMKMADVECASCLAVDENIARFAIVMREQGGWQINVYDIEENHLTLFKAFSGDDIFGLQPNPAQVALSPNGELLAYRFGDGPLKVYDFSQDDDVFEYSGVTNSLSFSQGGQYLFSQRDRDLIFWNVYDLQDGFRSILTSDPNAAMIFSRGGDYFAIASASRIRVYNVFPLSLMRDINVPLAEGRQVAWKIASENDESFLRGAALYWDADIQDNQVIQGIWDIGNGDTISVEVNESQSDNVFDEFWGLQLPSIEQPTAGFDLANIRAIRFSGADSLLINSLNSVCFFRLATSEATCQVSEDAPMHALDGPVFREIRQERNTLLVNSMGETVFEVGPHPIEWVSRAGDFILIDNRRSTTDMYVKNRTLPVQSVPGVLQSVSENISHIVFLTRQANGLMYITMVEKDTQKAVFQKRETQLYNFLDMTLDGTVYYLREEYTGNQATLRAIPGGSDETLELMKIDLLAPLTSLAVSPHNIMAIGMRDGAIIIIELDSLTIESFQALQTEVVDLAFSPDSRYLAVTGRNGLAVFAVLP